MDLSTFSTVFFSAAEKKINLNCQNEQHHSTLKCWQLTFTQFLSPKYCFPSKPLTLVQRYATFLLLCEFFSRSAGPEVTPRPNSPCTPQGLSPAYPDPPAHQHHPAPARPMPCTPSHGPTSWAPSQNRVPAHSAWGCCPAALDGVLRRIGQQTLLCPERYTRCPRLRDLPALMPASQWSSFTIIKKIQSILALISEVSCKSISKW